MKPKKQGFERLKVPLLIIGMVVIFTFGFGAVIAAHNSGHSHPVSTYTKTNTTTSNTTNLTKNTTNSATIYVSPSGSDSAIGDASHPKKTIKNAVATVKSGGIISLASGTYNENSISISKAVTIQGTNSVINGNGARILNVGNYVVNINGVQFTNGKADYGGAISNSGSLTLTNCLFQNNAATKYGGAINNNKILTVKGCTFTGNNVIAPFEAGYGSGGGILNNAGCTLTVDSSTFNNNLVGSYGAGILNIGTATLTNNQYTSNTAGEGPGLYTTSGGNTIATGEKFNTNHAISGAGGAASNYHSITTLKNCIFTGNTALKFGGAIYNDGQDSTSLTHSSMSIIGCTFNGNRAGDAGGAIHTYRGTITVNNSVFTNNIAATYGGAISGYNGVLVESGNKYTGNTPSPQMNLLMG